MGDRQQRCGGGGDATGSSHRRGGGGGGEKTANDDRRGLVPDGAADVGGMGPATGRRPVDIAACPRVPGDRGGRGNRTSTWSGRLIGAACTPFLVMADKLFLFVMSSVTDTFRPFSRGRYGRRQLICAAGRRVHAELVPKMNAYE